MARKDQPDQRKSRVRTSEGQVPNAGQKVNDKKDNPNKNS